MVTDWLDPPYLLLITLDALVSVTSLAETAFIVVNTKKIRANCFKTFLLVLNLKLKDHPRDPIAPPKYRPPL